MTALKFRIPIGRRRWKSWIVCPSAA